MTKNADDKSPASAREEEVPLEKEGAGKAGAKRGKKAGKKVAKKAAKKTAKKAPKKRSGKGTGKRVERGPAPDEEAGGQADGGQAGGGQAGGGQAGGGQAGGGRAGTSAGSRASTTTDSDKEPESKRAGGAAAQDLAESRTEGARRDEGSLQGPDPDSSNGERAAGGVLAALSAYLWTDRRRPYTIAIVATLLLVFAWRFGGDESPEAAQAVSPAAEEARPGALWQEARAQVAAGDPLGAIRRLDPEVTRTDRKGGDARLHAALAHAYAQAGWGRDAVPHFAWAVRTDPEAVEEEDLYDLVRLLGLPGKVPEKVSSTLVEVGRRAVPVLREAFEDPHAPVLVRRRAGEILQRLGEEVSLVEVYRRLLAHGACPARKEAVARLAGSTEADAARLLEEVAKSGRCGAAEARRALGQP